MRSGWLVTIGTLAVAGTLTAQEERPPAAVTVEQARQGLDLYHGKGACAICHGEFGLGTPDGPELVRGRWKLGNGSYDWLVHISRHAGWGARTREGEPQPMRGPTVLDSAEVAAVAVYVWTISRGRAGS
ncbi:MAG TPA: c-type cytochrome [Gemmatimonadales bacterium]|jgi:mono/diheme cytochrome c family protein